MTDQSIPQLGASIRSEQNVTNVIQLADRLRHETDDPQARFDRLDANLDARLRRLWPDHDSSVDALTRCSLLCDDLESAVSRLEARLSVPCESEPQLAEIIPFRPRRTASVTLDSPASDRDDDPLERVERLLAFVRSEIDAAQAPA